MASPNGWITTLDHGRGSIDARIQAKAAINCGGMAIAHPRTRSCSKTTARHEGWRHRVSVSWTTPRPSPEVVRRPMSGRPISTIQPPVTVVGAMRRICPPKGGYHAPRRRWSLHLGCQRAARPLQRTTNGAHPHSRTSYFTGGGVARCR